MASAVAFYSPGPSPYLPASRGEEDSAQRNYCQPSEITRGWRRGLSPSPLAGESDGPPGYLPPQGGKGYAAPRPAQPLIPARPESAIKVPVMVAISFSSPPSIAKAFPSQTVIVRPGFTTFPLKRKRSPRAGARRLVLNSMVRMEASAGISEKAA